MTFARWTFRLAGIWGLLVLLPQCFMEAEVGRQYPPAITHPEFFYGFCGVGVAWQLAFLVMSQDPARYRPMMLPAMVEKFSFGLAAIWLFSSGRIPPVVMGFASVDLLLGSAFIAAYFLTARDAAGSGRSDTGTHHAG